MSDLRQSIMMHLGYGSGASFVGTIDAGSAYEARIQTIVMDLFATDAALSAARLDSMAVQIDKLQVDYNQHMSILKSEGTRLLGELEFLTGQKIAYNKYEPTTGSATSIRNRTAILSYY